MLKVSQRHEKLIEESHDQKVKLLDELQSINKKNANLRKQLANGIASIVSVANVADAANYRLCEIRPKK